jgi:trehalose 6-phosphate synthase/phosphatase
VPSQSLLRILQDLSDDPRNEVAIISGRGRDFLDRWFSDFRINLVAEHGAWVRLPGSDWQAQAPDLNGWKPNLKPLLERYVDRVAGSFVEEKDSALVWHYRGAEAEPGKLAAQELKDHLLSITANIDLRVIQGNKTVEVRTAGANKAIGGLRLLSKGAHDFILCIGDDTTDEDLFAVLPDTANSIRVGLGHTCARHTIPDVKDVVKLLEDLTLPRDNALRCAVQEISEQRVKVLF